MANHTVLTIARSAITHSLDIVSQVYDLNPYDKMTFVYCPSHREKAKENLDYGTVHIGVGAKRGKQPLKIFKTNGEPFKLHPTYLTFQVLPTGTIYVELLPFRQAVDDDYVAAISGLIKEHSDILTSLLYLAHIRQKSDLSYCEFVPLHEAIIPEEIGIYGIKLVSPQYYFPVSLNRGLNELILAFTLLYGLAESFIYIGEGKETHLEKRLKQFIEWYIKCGNAQDELKEQETQKENGELVEIPELDSYSFVRAGKWWGVLARDQWKCCSCGRSAKADGVILEVDHIIPRSKGGSDDISNLQTLCKKCNIGKSNRDSTRL